MNRLFFRDLLTGLVALAALAGLIMTLVFFGELTPLAERNYEIKLRVANAGGLDETSPVLLNGVKVGQVVSSRASPPPRVGAELVVRLRRGVEVPRAAKVSIDRGFVGGSSLEFITLDLTPEQLSDAVRPDETLDGGNPETLLGSIRTLVEGPLQQLSTTASKIDVLAEEYTEVGRRINDLLEPRAPQDVAAGKTPNLRSTLTRVDTAVANLNLWLADDQLRTRVNDVLAKADGVLTDAKELADAWTTTATKADTALTNVQNQVETVGTKVTQLADEARASFARLQSAADGLATAVENVNAGKGTLGQLATNPDLYRNLDDAAQRLNKALDEAQLVLEKLKAEGIRLRL